MRLFFLFFVFFVSSCLGQNFAGVWTDFADLGGYGGTLYICQDGDLINGAYSEVGIIFGTVDGNTATGKWVEVGANTRECAYGSFEWSLSQTGEYFTGTYTCEDLTREQHDWKSTRVSIIPPNYVECAKLSSSDNTTIDGVWTQNDDIGVRAICNTGSSYTSSYRYFSNERNNTIDGYETGAFILGNQFDIASGYSLEDSKTGISLLFVLEDGSLGQFWWFALGDNGPDPRDSDDENLHQYRIYNFVEEASDSECQANNLIRFIPDNDYIDDYDVAKSSETSSATSLLKCLTLLLFILSVCF